MATENLPEKSAFQLMDEADELQIISDSNVKQSLVYKVQGKETLSYTGIKFLFQKYIQEKELSVEIIHDESYCKLEKDIEDDSNHWFWRSQFTLKTTRTSEDGKIQIIETQGQSESPYKVNGQYDSFGRTKAFSKSERNADRKQIPEFELTHMINQVQPKDVNTFTTKTTVTSDSPSEKQLDYLKNLGYTGPKPDTKQIASNIIEDLKNGAVTAENDKKNNNYEKIAKQTIDDYNKYCSCENPIPNSITNGKTCQTCKKLMRQ